MSEKGDMLDALNEDCCRLVLSYVPVHDILRAERVDRRWQHAVLKYLRGVRIRIEPALHHYEKTRGPHCRVLQHFELHQNAAWFEQVTSKLGSSIVASYCYNECTLLTLLNNCPNLEHLVLLGIAKNYILLTEEVISVKKLKQITFKYLMNVDDNCIGKFVGNNTLEEITIYSNEVVTGHCLLSLPLNLKYLSLICCKSLQLNHLLAALQILPCLMKLELTKLAPEILQNAHLLLNEVIKLEDLALNFDTEIELKEDILQSISRLSRLKRLDLSMNPNVTDDWLEAVRGCWQLEELNVTGCSGRLYLLHISQDIYRFPLHLAVSARAVVKLCRATGSALTVLSVASISTMNDDHILAIIKSCPNLESLNVSHCPVSANFTSAAAQLCTARARPLRLRAEHTQLQRFEGPYQMLTVDFGDSDDDWDDHNDNDEDSDSDCTPE